MQDAGMHTPEWSSCAARCVRSASVRIAAALIQVHFEEYDRGMRAASGELKLPVVERIAADEVG